MLWQQQEPTLAYRHGGHEQHALPFINTAQHTLQPLPLPDPLPPPATPPSTSSCASLVPRPTSVFVLQFASTIVPSNRQKYKNGEQG